MNVPLSRTCVTQTALDCQRSEIELSIPTKAIHSLSVQNDEFRKRSLEASIDRSRTFLRKKDLEEVLDEKYNNLERRIMNEAKKANEKICSLEKKINKKFSTKSESVFSLKQDRILRKRSSLHQVLVMNNLQKIKQLETSVRKIIRCTEKGRVEKFPQLLENIFRKDYAVMERFEALESTLFLVRCSSANMTEISHLSESFERLSSKSFFICVAVLFGMIFQLSPLLKLW